MIPYDDLVAALSAWRTRQGLPVSTVGVAPAQPGSGPVAMTMPGSGPTATPGSGPNRGGPPMAAPPGRPRSPSMPPPVAVHEEEVVDDAAMLEEHYEAEGDDFAMNFNPNAAAPSDGESTQIGGAPERPTEADMGGGRNDRDDW